MIKDIIADLQKLDRGPSVMRKFGLFSALIFLLLGLMITYKHWNDPVTCTKGALVFFGLTAAFTILAMVYPNALKPVNIIMSFIAMIIGWLLTRVILALMFYTVFFIFGFIMKIIGKDSLKRKINRNSPSYWVKREDYCFDKERCKRLF